MSMGKKPKKDQTTNQLKLKNCIPKNHLSVFKIAEDTPQTYFGNETLKYR